MGGKEYVYGDLFTCFLSIFAWNRNIHFGSLCPVVSAMTLFSIVASMWPWPLVKCMCLLELIVRPTFAPDECHNDPITDHGNDSAKQGTKRKIDKLKRKKEIEKKRGDLGGDGELQHFGDALSWGIAKLS